jgi:putative transposase
MRTSRFTAEQIVGIRKEHAAGAGMAELCRRHGVSQQTLYRWRRKYGGRDRSEAVRLKALEDENARRKRLVAERALDLQAPRDLLRKNS